MGSGAFASVWLGHDDDLDSDVAIKVLADNWARHGDVRARFLTEARLLRKADSDRILRVLDIGELDDGRPYFVTNYADRGSLEDRLTAEGELSLGEALEVLAEVAEAVDVLHGIEVIHRDLKPSNVLFTTGPDGEEQLVLADLGLAKAMALSSGLTVMAGSPGYMAPEQSQPGGEVDARTDIYGLGALAHRLLTGVTLGSPGAAPLPREIEQAVERALRTDRGRRWPTMRAFADRLRELSTKKWGRRPKRRLPRFFRSRAVAAAMVVFIVLGVGVWRWGPDVWGKDGDPPSNASASKSAGTSDDDFVACSPDGISVEMNEPSATADETDVGLSLFFSAKDATMGGVDCIMRGYLTDLRFLTTTGEDFGVKTKQDDFKAPSKIPVRRGWVAEVDLRWKGENVPGIHVLPATMEFRLPGSKEPVRLPWRGGYINVAEPLYHSVAFPAGN